MLKGFKDFILRGNVIDLAVAVVVGAAFTAIVTAFTDNIINPLIAVVGGNNELGWGFQITDSAATFVNFGAVISAVINFLMVAAVVYFVLVLPMNKLLPTPKEEPKETDHDVLVEIRDLIAGSSVSTTASAAPTGQHAKE